MLCRWCMIMLNEAHTHTPGFQDMCDFLSQYEVIILPAPVRSSVARNDPLEDDQRSRNHPVAIFWNEKKDMGFPFCNGTCLYCTYTWVLFWRNSVGTHSPWHSILVGGHVPLVSQKTHHVTFFQWIVQKYWCQEYFIGPVFSASLLKTNPYLKHPNV